MRQIMKFLILAFLILSSLLGCATSTPRQISVKTEGGIEHNVIIGYRDQSSLPSGYHVLIEEGNSGWFINKISEKPILNRQNSKQEILYINEALNYVQPYFEKVEVFNGITFECTPLLDDKRSYTPCNSRLMTVNVGMSIGKNIISAVTTLGLASGTHKAIDTEKISNIIQQTNLITKIREYQQHCDTSKQNALSFMDKIVVFPQIVDKSGFYSDDKIVNINKKINSSLDCPIDLNKIEYLVSINLVETKFKAKIEPSSYVLRYNAEGYQLKPVVTIHARDFVGIYPPYTHEDEYLRIEFDGKLIRFINKTNRYVKIKSITVYYNKDVFNIETSRELPPESFNNYPLVTSDNIQQNSNYFNLTVETAKKTFLSFGFAIKYTLVEQNIDRTLYKINEYNLYSALKLMGY